jgi:protein-S-isoprenylcysteine O-methyltransferase
MLARLVLNSLICSIVFLAPLVTSPERLAQPAPWFALAVALVTLMSQPSIDFREATDRFSGLGIFAAMFAAQAASAIDFGRSPVVAAGWPFAVGAGVAIGGLSLRLWSILTLGRYFTAAVRVVDAQPVVRSGPYRVLRHPSYTGAILGAIGTAIALRSTVGVALVFSLGIPAYLYRMAVEERVLIGKLGAAYATYRKSTWGLLPGLR